MSSAKTQFFDLPDSGGCRMAYRTLNTASPRTPLFLINGLSAVMTDWSPLFEALAATRPVVISDHRAIGESTVTEEWDQELTLESMGLDVLHLASHLGYTTIDLLGFSMGGHITQALLSSPSATVVDGLVSLSGVKIRKAVLSATMTKLPRGDANLNELNAQAEKIPDKKQRNEFITDQMMRLQYHPSALESNPTLQRKFQSRLREVRQTSRPAWIIGLQFMAIQQTDLRKQLHRIPPTVPVLVIHGKRDRMVLWNESEHILAGIKHASRLTTPDEEFAHFWYDYFDIDFWSTSIVNFLDDQTKSKL